MYKSFYDQGIIIRCLENYDNPNVKERDKEMANRFITIINEQKADKYFVYVGNMHVLAESMKIYEFTINPIKIYLPKDILQEILTITFSKADKKFITFDKKTNTIEYAMPYSNF